MKEIYLLKYTNKQTIFADKFIENEMQDESYVNIIREVSAPKV